MATKKQQSNTNYYIIIGLVTALAIVATIFVAQSLVKTALHNNRVNNALNKANNQLTENLTAANDLISAYNNLGPTQQLIVNALPSTGDYPGLSALLENAGNVTSVNVKSVTVTPQNQSVPSGTASGAKGLAFSTSVTGTYSSILAFLGALQQSARPIQVTSLQLSGTGSNMTAQITGIAYYQEAVELPFKKDVVK